MYTERAVKGVALCFAILAYPKFGNVISSLLHQVYLMITLLIIYITSQSNSYSIVMNITKELRKISKTKEPEIKPAIFRLIVRHADQLLNEGVLGKITRFMLSGSGWADVN